MVRLRGLLCVYQVGIPLLGSPGVSLHVPSPSQQPHILFEWGGGGLGECGGALCVLHGQQSLPLVYNLKIDKIQLVKDLSHEEM